MAIQQEGIDLVFEGYRSGEDGFDEADLAPVSAGACGRGRAPRVESGGGLDEDCAEAVKLAACTGGEKLQLDKFGTLQRAGAEDGDVGEWAADHGDFVAGVEARAGLAVLVDFVGHGGAVGDAEAEVIEEVGDAGEEADAHDLVVFGFVDERFEDRRPPAPRPFGFGLDDDGADFGEVRAVEMEGAAAEEFGGVVADGGAVGDGEVADVFAELGVAAAEECAVAGERVDEVEDVAGVLQAGFVDAQLRVRRGVSRGRAESGACTGA